MPQIVVTADGLESRTGREVMRERVAVSDLESELFTAHLIERIEWALADADASESRPSDLSQHAVASPRGSAKDRRPQARSRA